MKSGEGGIELVKKLMSKEAAYVLGVILGDGWITRDKTHYSIGLDAKSYRFALKFSECMTKILHNLKQMGIRKRKVKIIKPIYLKRDNVWRVRYSCKQLYFPLKTIKDSVSNNDISILKHIVETQPQYINDFIKGIFDSDGGDGKMDIRLTNSNYTLLQYIRYLLINYYHFPEKSVKIVPHTQKDEITKIKGKNTSEKKIRGD